MMKTHCQGYTKKHIGCGGIVRYVESIDTYYEWEAECLECGDILCEEDIEIEKR